MNKMNKKGFTLIEMLVVIAIIAILVSIIVPVVSNSTEKAAAATNAANLRSMSASIAIKVLEGKIDAEGGITTGEVTGAGLTIPVAKTCKSITAGDFTVEVKGDNITCSFGDKGTIQAYGYVAEGKNPDGTE